MKNLITWLRLRKPATEPVVVPFRPDPEEIMANHLVTEHFALEELVCPCCERLRITPGVFAHMELLERLRRDFGMPVYINSAYRCPDHNKDVKGTPHSWHMLFATDIRGPEPDMTHDLYKIALSLDFGGIGLYETFIHLDTRPESVRWRG